MAFQEVKCSNSNDTAGLIQAGIELSNQWLAVSEQIIRYPFKSLRDYYLEGWRSRYSNL